MWPCSSRTAEMSLKAAQAAMVVQIRAGDAHALQVCSALDDSATRVAATLELDVLRTVGDDASATVSAHATVDEAIDLFVRVASRDGSRFEDRRFSGATADEVRDQAIVAITAIIGTSSAEVVR